MEWELQWNVYQEKTEESIVIILRIFQFDWSADQKVRNRRY
jgi:hypothetical protein